jgi:hypothetical protein
MIEKETICIYKIPQKILKLIKAEFMFVFKNEIDHYYENDNYKNIATYNNFYLYIEGTVGWEKSLTKTCRKTNSFVVLDYYLSLERNDRDFFDDELCMMLVKEKIMTLGKNLD